MQKIILICLFFSFFSYLQGQLINNTVRTLEEELAAIRKEEDILKSIFHVTQTNSQPTSQPSSRPSSQPTARPSTEPSAHVPVSHLPSYGSWAPATTVQPMVFTVTQPVNGINCNQLPLPAAQLSVLLDAVADTVKVPRSDIVNFVLDCAKLRTRRSLGTPNQPYLAYGVVVQNSQNFTNAVNNIVTTAQNGQLQQSILAAAQAQNITALLQVTVPPTPPQFSPLVQASSPSPSVTPTALPSLLPSIQPSVAPSSNPSSSNPSVAPSAIPSTEPSYQSTVAPSFSPTCSPTKKPSVIPSLFPSKVPFKPPSTAPSPKSSFKPSQLPSSQPSSKPSSQPSTAAHSISTLFSHGVDGASEVSIVAVGAFFFFACCCALVYLVILYVRRKRRDIDAPLDFGKMYEDKAGIIPKQVSRLNETEPLTIFNVAEKRATAQATKGPLNRDISIKV